MSTNRLCQQIHNHVTHIQFSSNNVAEMGQQLGRGDESWVLYMMKCLMVHGESRVLTRYVLKEWITEREKSRRKSSKHLSTLIVTFTNEMGVEEVLAEVKLVISSDLLYTPVSITNAAEMMSVVNNNVTETNMEMEGK